MIALSSSSEAAQLGSMTSNEAATDSKKLSLDLSPSQLKAFHAMTGSPNVFLTGLPGTGKSFLVREFLKENRSKKIPVLASTGAAAILVGGRTFHSFFGLGRMDGGAGPTLEKALKNKTLRTRLRKAECIVIDEVSMISHEALDVAEQIARAHLDMKKPWGGIRIIAVGDFAQLPPVSRDVRKPWAFLGEAWASSAFETHELREVLRTRDEELLRLFEKIRWGELDSEVRAFLDDKVNEDPSMDVPHIYPRRIQSERFNKTRLAELSGKTYEYLTRYSGEDYYLEKLQRDAPVPPILELKEGALVMFRINDPKQRFVNGSVGRVYDLSKEQILVELKSRVIQVEKFAFAIQDADGKEVAVAENYPLNLAYASTIHKAQGTSLDAVHADLRQLWEPGQAYVALTRATGSKGLTLAGWTEESFRFDPMVRDFHETYSRSSNDSYG